MAYKKLETIQDLYDRVELEAGAIRVEGLNEYNYSQKFGEYSAYIVVAGWIAELLQHLKGTDGQ